MPSEPPKKKTSGEIRVHLESTTNIDPYERAMEVFEKLNMHKTQHRNGVLFYFAVDERTFVIFGDEGINNTVPDDFWESTKNEMVTHFKNGNFKTGIVEGILKAGKELREHFPYQEDDANELPNDISKGKI